MAGPAQVPRQRFAPSVPAIEADAIGFNYGERRALFEVSFEIARGEIFGFLGPNGGGKTTLFRLLSTLVAMQSGRARVLGLDLADATRDVRRRMGVVFQHPSVDGKLSVLENLQHHGHLYGMSGKELSARAATMLEQFGIANRSGDRVETLSGGLRRRVELAKALLHRPELLLLDEPSTGLDPVARREFLGIVGDLRTREGVTVVLTTHYMEEAERCDRIGLLHQGKLVAIGSPSELKSQVGGDVIVIHTGAPDLLQRKVAERFKVKTMIVDGTIRIERSRGHELVRDLVEAFGSDIDSISFGKPTLEDVFVHLTGEKFFASEARA